MGGAGGIRPHQNLLPGRIIRVRTVRRRQLFQRLLQHGDVVGCGITPRVAGSQQPGQCFTTGDLGAVEEHQQRVMAPGLLPCRGRVLLVVGMVDGDGGIDVEVQPPAGRRGRPGRPRRRPGRRPRGADPRQMGGVDPLIDQPPHRGRGGGRTEDMFAITAPLPDTVDAVRAAGHRRRQIGEHRPRIVYPRSPIGIRQRNRYQRRQPGQAGDLPQHPHPGVRHDSVPVRGHFHPRNRCDTVHLRSAFQPANGNREKFHYALQDRHFRLSTRRRSPHFTNNPG